MTDVTSTPPEPPRPWGILATLGWVVLAAVVSVVVTIAALMLWYGGDLERVPDLLSDGLAFSTLSIVTAVIQTAVLMAAARLARWRVVDYLALTWPNRRDGVMALWAIVVFVVGFDVLTSVLGRDVVTPFQLVTYHSAREAGAVGLLLLWVAFVVTAPVSEEIMFRGFLFRGWAVSPRAVWTAIVVISALWAVIHVQYDWFGILQIFIGGLVLGWARWRSGSTLLTIALHALTNAWATLQTMIKVDWLL